MLSKQDEILFDLLDFKVFAPAYFKIRSKSGEIRPFKLNRAQTYLHNRLEEQRQRTGKVRAVCLKGRQQGCSTYIQGRYTHKVLTSKGVKAYILTHEQEATNNLFDMTRRYIDGLPDGLAPKPDALASTKIHFKSLDSGYAVGTAGNKGAGRSQTIQLFHGCLSEDSLIVLASGNSKTMRDIEIGDNVITSSGQIAPVKNKIYTGNKLTYELSCWSSGEPIYLTADHKVLTLAGYKKLSELSKLDYVAMPSINPSNKITHYNFCLKNKERSQGGGSKHIESHSFELNYDFGYFVGYYLAEGHIKKNEGYITFTYHISETYIDKALKGISGIETSIRHQVEEKFKRKRTHINGKFLASAINEMFGRVSQKNIPAWVFNANHEFLKGIINGYLDGDGSKKNLDSITAPSIHESITRQMQRICWSLYGACSVKKFSRKRYETKTKDIFLMRICGNSLASYQGRNVGKRKEKSIFINNTVYCRVKNILPRKIEPVWDIEVDHQDHNYQTTTGIVSNSEVAFWPHAEEHAKGVMQAISRDDGTEIILESTANGIGNYFYSLWQSASGESEYQAIFLPWYWQDEYTNHIPGFQCTTEEQELIDQFGKDGLTAAHLSWRRIKIAEFSNDFEIGLERFKQEYPMTAAEAFRNPIQNVFIPARLVLKARKNDIRTDSPLIIGVDVARGESDRNAIIRRQGRRAYNLEKFWCHNLMELCGKLKRVIIEEKPAKVYVDCIGIGAGVVDRMNEMGYDCVEGVNTARSANDKEKFLNLRAELWSDGRDWLSQEMDVEIPDSDELQGELCSLGYKFKTSGGQLQIESKEDLRARGMPSPDGADALMLTFAAGWHLAQNQIIVDKQYPHERGMFR